MRDSTKISLMWNLAYDRVLRTALPSGCSATVCYADDTLVITGGETGGSEEEGEPSVGVYYAFHQGAGYDGSAPKD